MSVECKEVTVTVTLIVDRNLPLWRIEEYIKTALSSEIGIRDWQDDPISRIDRRNIAVNIRRNAYPVMCPKHGGVYD